MTYRDDQDALLARNDALEDENARLRRERDELTAKLAQKDAPPPADEPEVTPPPRQARRRLRRPWWIIALALPLLLIYLFEVGDMLATFALGHDPLGVPAWMWFPGCMFLIIGLGWGMPSRSGRHSHTHLAPKWIWAVVLAHLVTLVVTIALGRHYLPALSTLFLAFGNVLAWYGEWE